MQTTWIVVADNRRARIFERRDSAQGFEEVEDLASPGSVPGAAGHGAGADIAADLFSHTVARFLNDAYGQQRYDRLCVVAAPAVFGRLRASITDSMSEPVQHAVEAELPADLGAMPVEQVEQYVGAKVNLH